LVGGFESRELEGGGRVEGLWKERKKSEKRRVKRGRRGEVEK
jgi:hypothetical protein